MSIDWRRTLILVWMVRVARIARVLALLLALVPFSATPSNALAGSQLTASGPDLSKGRYRESWVDLSVKVPGGTVSLVRAWNGRLEIDACQSFDPRAASLHSIRSHRLPLLLKDPSLYPGRARARARARSEDSSELITWTHETDRHQS